MKRLRLKLDTPSREYEISIGPDLIQRLGTVARQYCGRSGRVAIISNETVFSLYGSKARESISGKGLSVTHWLMRDGERFKSLRTLEQALAFFSTAGLDRNDIVVALGGGVVGDLAGFAAATYLRGISLIQVPTTLLSQIDSSVGGKTGINLPTGKNLVGAFHQPRAVIIDTRTLDTLPPRELTAGWCEAIKHGALSGRLLFDRTTRFLKQAATRPAGKSGELDSLIAEHCNFKAAIVSGDERESLGRDDRFSRRVLNFGHTVGHALEAVTGYRRFKHGEAVGWGILAAAEISKSLRMLDDSELELLRRGVALCGPLPRVHDIEPEAIIASIANDKKRVGDNINWILLEAIGRPHIVNGRQVPSNIVKSSLHRVFQQP